MIQELTTFIVSAPINGGPIFDFQLDQNMNVQNKSHISVVEIAIPKCTYQIGADFMITIDATNITFSMGDISFQEFILKLRDELGTGYTCIEYLSDVHQSSGRLFI